ncbi:MAG: 30S ribosomal protein S8 [Candidatus Omnitrophica bacterium]|nr:30S ribosomal protein S8 [Candidatus Omnitrophota bacterium]
MSLNDPIADALTRIRNALRAKKESVDIPNSNVLTAIADILKREGYIENFKIMTDNKQGILRIYLKYVNTQPAIKNLIRVSKSSRRIYVKAKDKFSVLRGLGLAIISTSEGIMTDKQAREKNIGGELICKVW